MWLSLLYVWGAEVSESFEKAVEVAAVVGGAVAGPDVAAGPMLEHESEVLRAHAGVGVAIDVVVARHIRGGGRGQLRLGGAVDRRGIATLVPDCRT